MRTLLQAVHRYETTKRPRYTERFAALAQGQEPYALFVTCSDSRVVPNLIALADPGDLFVVRNVANLVPPAGDGGDASVSSALWYAVEVLRVREIVVCGHSGCGGVRALMELPPPALERWLAPATTALHRWQQLGPLDPSLPQADQLSQVCALHQVDNLLSYEFVRERVEAGELSLHAWWFDIPSAKLLAHSREAGRFVPVLEALADDHAPKLLQ